jgi:hypothetical protein
MRTGAVAIGLLAAVCASAQTKTLIARLSEEADAFRRLAPEVLGKEDLHQRSQKSPPRFRPRIGDAARKAPEAVWQERQIQSEYAFSMFVGEDTLRELRQVISVDGKPVKEQKNAEETLARIITAKDYERQKELLKQFEKYGLLGAATDFGQLLLMFTPRNIEQFEFREQGAKMLGSERCLVYAYSQIDGPEALTIFPSKADEEPLRVRAQGEVWVRADNLLPMRITLVARRSKGEAEVREEAYVDYSLSRFGALLPTATHHQELHGGRPVAENTFVYTDFHQFAASSELKFDFGDDPK